MYGRQTLQIRWKRRWEMGTKEALVRTKYSGHLNFKVLVKDTFDRSIEVCQFLYVAFLLLLFIGYDLIFDSGNVSLRRLQVQPTLFTLKHGNWILWTIAGVRWGSAVAAHMGRTGGITTRSLHRIVTLPTRGVSLPVNDLPV